MPMLAASSSTDVESPPKPIECTETTSKQQAVLDETIDCTTPRPSTNETCVLDEHLSHTDFGERLCLVNVGLDDKKQLWPALKFKSISELQEAVHDDVDVPHMQLARLRRKICKHGQNGSCGIAYLLGRSEIKRSLVTLVTEEMSKDFYSRIDELRDECKCTGDNDLKRVCDIAMSRIVDIDSDDETVALDYTPTPVKVSPSKQRSEAIDLTPPVALMAKRSKKRKFEATDDWNSRKKRKASPTSTAMTGSQLPLTSPKDFIKCFKNSQHAVAAKSDLNLSQNDTTKRIAIGITSAKKRAAKSEGDLKSFIMFAAKVKNEWNLEAGKNSLAPLGNDGSPRDESGNEGKQLLQSVRQFIQFLHENEPATEDLEDVTLKYRFTQYNKMLWVLDNADSFTSVAEVCRMLVLCSAVRRERGN